MLAGWGHVHGGVHGGAWLIAATKPPLGDAHLQGAPTDERRECAALVPIGLGTGLGAHVAASISPRNVAVSSPGPS